MPHAVSPERGHGFDPAEPIAVVGMAMRFPGGATDSKRFWDSKCNSNATIGLRLWKVDSRALVEYP